MPTRGRQAFAKQALDCFMSQTYPNKELVILDDSDEPSFPDGVDIPGVRYYSGERRNIPTKRNLCCGYAKDGIIMHFDSDDWSAPERMADQVNRMMESGKEFTGYHTMLFHSPNGVFRYQGRKNYAIGTSFAFTKSFWNRHPFPEAKDLSSDNAVVYGSPGELISVDAGQLMVARIHGGNTNPKKLGPSFKPVWASDLPAEFHA